MALLAGTTLSVALAHEGQPMAERYWLMVWTEQWSNAFGFYPTFEKCEFAFNDAFTGIKEKPKHICLHIPRP